MAEQKKYQVNFADCYVLANKRTISFILSFLERYVPNRQVYGDAYEIPQFSEEPAIIFNTAEELIEYLEQNKNEVQALYWHNKEESKLRGAMCLFTSDGQVILGLFCETLYPDTSNESNFLKDLMNFCNSTKGLIEYGKPAARDTGEFLQRIAANTQNNGSKK